VPKSVLNASLLRKAQELLESRNSFVFVTVIETAGSTPREIGASMIITSDGRTVDTIGGGYAEAKVMQESLRALEEGRSKIVDLDLTRGLKGDSGAICGGSMTVFIDVMKPLDAVIIFGAGHIGQALTRLAKFLKFSVVVVDERKEFANRERLPEADTILAEEYGVAIDKLRIGSESYIVIVTHGHERDELILKNVLGSKAAYIGMIGSRTKCSTIMMRLKEEGYPEESLKKVHAPIGIEIEAETPEEIALSIMAEVTLTRNTIRLQSSS
jgi:xanthine dehydrogenase accessory factor